MHPLRRLPALPALLIVLSLVAGACDVFSTTTTPAPSTSASAVAVASGSPTAGQSSGAPSASTSAAPTVTASPTPTPTPAPTPSPTPRPTPEACPKPTPTDLSKDWKTLEAHDGDFTFKYPKEWEELYGAFLFSTSSLLDPVTFAETGLPAEHTTKADLVRAPETGLPNASVLIVPGVLSAAPDVYLRQELKFRQIVDAEILQSDLKACLDGLTAYGVEFVFGENDTLQQSWYVVHNGRSYDFQWLATKAKPDRAIFQEMFRTWKWTPNFPAATPRPTPSTTPTPAATPAPSVSGSAFLAAGMAASITSGAPKADTSTFTRVLAKDLTSIYAVFILAPGLTGRVEGDLMKGNRVLATLALDYRSNHTWGDFRINSASGFEVGTDYEMRIRYMPTGEEITLPFAVE